MSDDSPDTRYRLQHRAAPAAVTDCSTGPRAGGGLHRAGARGRGTSRVPLPEGSPQPSPRHMKASPGLTHRAGPRGR